MTKQWSCLIHIIDMSSREDSLVVSFFFCIINLILFKHLYTVFGSISLTCLSG